MSDIIRTDMDDEKKAATTITQEEIDLIKKEDTPFPEQPTPWMHGEKYASQQYRDDALLRRSLQNKKDPDNKFLEKDVLTKIRSFDRKRPVGADPNEFYGPKRLSHRSHLIGYLAACGFTQKEIAEQMGMNTIYISKYLRTERMQEIVKEKSFELFGKGAQEKFMRLLPKAIDTAEKVMADELQKGSVRADVAFKFMDRALGKPKQQIEHNVSNIRTLIEKLDEVKFKEPIKQIETTAKPDDNIIDVQTEPSESREVPKDEIDDWIDKNIS